MATLLQQAIQDEQGDFIQPVEQGLLAWADIKELGQLVGGKVSGRTQENQITIFKQNSDQGVGFMALARLAHDKARRDGIGTKI